LEIYIVSYTDIGWRKHGIKQDAGVVKSRIRAGGAGVLLAIATQIFAGRKRGERQKQITYCYCKYIVLGMDYGGEIVEWKNQGSMRSIDKDVILMYNSL
jgi:hypothetical protein